jgi:hypothetical protein
MAMLKSWSAVEPSALVARTEMLALPPSASRSIAAAVGDDTGDRVDGKTVHRDCCSASRCYAVVVAVGVAGEGGHAHHRAHGQSFSVDGVGRRVAVARRRDGELVDVVDRDR